jgi:predicted transcriptional regulator
MNPKWSQVKIVEEILKTAGSDEQIVCRRLELSPEEYEQYREHILSRGLAVEIDGDPGVLALTDAGKALLRLMNDIDTMFSPEEATDPATCRVEVEGWSSEMGLAETIEWRDRVLQSYMLEQVEVETLEARLGDGEDAALRTELEERHRRLARLEGLLERMGQVTSQLEGPGAGETGPERPARTRQETIKVLVNRLFQAYVLEQAEVTRLAVQLQGWEEEEGRQEMEQRQRRLEILGGLLETLQRVAGNLPA